MELFVSTGNWILALGKTLIHSLWMGLVLLSFLQFTLYCLPERHSKLRYQVSLAFLFVLLGLVIYTFAVLYSPGKSLLPYVKIKGRLPVRGNWMSSTHLVIMISSYLYLAGIPFAFIRTANSLRILKKVKKSGSPVQQCWHKRLDLLKTSLGIGRKVGLLESELLTVPSLVGFLKPVILVPAGMLTGLPIHQVETILMHELIHLRRNDFIMNLIQLLIENILFFNPAVRAISKLIRIEREKCCDDRVIDSGWDPFTYAKALCKLAEQESQFAAFTPGAGGTTQSQLVIRVQRILNDHAMKKNIREKKFSLLVLLGGVIVLLTVSGFSSGFSIVRDNESRQKETVIPIMESAALPAQIADTLPLVDWEEIKKEVQMAKAEALENINWEEIKKEMEIAKAEALENIDWEIIKQKMWEARIQLDSAFQDMDFDFDLDLEVDVDLNEIRIEIKSAMKEIDNHLEKAWKKGGVEELEEK